MVTKGRVFDLGDGNKIIIKCDLTCERVAELLQIPVDISRNISIEDIEKKLGSIIKAIKLKNCVMEVYNDVVNYKYNYQDIELVKPSKRDIFDNEAQRIFKLYLDGILTIHEAGIILEDLKKEYLDNK